ncbi:hypothetical protein BDV96DRAFT_575373 [Lophiotrema nucula]|uniref:Uncharacterized protein n=1 Tax=Lophiotrema nucula TaxID=690887 RepID=A0A6A5Z8H8_9PLEO|nr:hypothetical protein BDV96DRAFT_575373 [Lophiotrema nucula]
MLVEKVLMLHWSALAAHHLPLIFASIWSQIASEFAYLGSSWTSFCSHILLTNSNGVLDHMFYQSIPKAISGLLTPP